MSTHHRTAPRLLVALLAAAATSTVGCSGEGEPPLATPPTATRAWRATGSLAMFSSPRLVDLDGDQTLDVVIGHGLPGDDLTGAGAAGYVTAHSGRDGAQLWRTEASQELFASATVLPLDGDAVPDLVIGGRRADLLAISGASGEVLWRFQPSADPTAAGSLQFYSGQPIGDINGDGSTDLLFANGGFPAAEPGEPRPTGFLVIISGADGALLASAPMPDGAETYMSALTYSRRGETALVFASGGETLPGSLWTATLDELLQGSLSGAVQLSQPSMAKGVIAPPALVDLTGDGTLDIACATFDGQLLAIDGDSLESLWSHQVPGAESYSTPAVGHFDGDGTPDLYAIFIVGTFPDYTRAEHRAVSGRRGELLWEFGDPGLAFGSPLAIDIGGDGRDELLAVLQQPGADGSDLLGGDRSTLVYIDVRARLMTPLTDLTGFAPTTPWVGDIDADGLLDVVVGAAAFGELSASWVLERHRLTAAAPPHIPWGAYLGTAGDGRYQAP